MHRRSNQHSLATGLARDYFVSKEIFDRESERVFATHWLYIGHVDECFEAWRSGSPACFCSRQIESHSVLLVRRDLNRLAAYHNVCRHRGAQLVSQPSGRLSNSRITCPYHAWTYDLEGHLVGAPNMSDVDGFDRSAFSLNRLGCANWNGLLFVHLTQSSDQLSAEFTVLNDRLKNWLSQPLRLAKAIEYEVAANWKLLFQNYSECYHCPTVHPDLNRLTPYKSATNDLTSGAILGGPMQLADGFDTVSRDGRLIGEMFSKLDDCQRRQVRYYTVFPNTFISAHPDYIMVHRLQRLGVDCTRVVCQFFVVPEGSTDVSRAVDLWDQVNRQDWHVCELTQRGVNSVSFRPGPYSNLESMLQAFDQHYLASIQSSGGTTTGEARG